MPVRPFVAELAVETLKDLRDRLQKTRWPGIVGSDDWRYGTPQGWLREMRDYWVEEWSWPSAATAMNAYPHFQVEIDGIPVHFMHIRSKRRPATPLLLTHGWPWTFWDFRYVIEPLTSPSTPDQPAFDLIIPSLPGFGFSTPLTKAGVDVATIAELWVRLMTRELGYQQFAAHGGDWGALITAHLSHAHAKHLIGAHMSLTMVPGVNRSDLGPEAWTRDEAWMQARNEEATSTISSHVAVHRLDPQTLAYGLMDSPLATAAWIWERRRNWSDCNGDVETAFTREHLCTTAALFWCTGAITSSLRIYFEHFNKPWPLAHERIPRLEAPSAYAVFPKDVVHMPRSVLEKYVNLKRYTIMPRGGHFAAPEQPELLVDDLRAFFRSGP